MSEEERNRNTEPEERAEALADTGDLPESEVAGDLGEAAQRGPAFDRDAGKVQKDTRRGRRKERVGLVVSDAADKTVTVSVETLKEHPMYKKRIRRSKKFLVHDERNEARVGDTVRIIETRPLSRRKRWRLASIISRAE